MQLFKRCILRSLRCYFGAVSYYRALEPRYLWYCAYKKYHEVRGIGIPLKNGTAVQR